MKLSDGTILTIPKVVELVYPWLTPQAIHLWTARGIFLPEQRRRGRYGSELSLSDAVTIGILHSLFTVGATFHELRLLGYRSPIPVNPITFIPKENPLGAWPAREEPRRIQLYLEHTEYKCHIYYEPARSFIETPAGDKEIEGGKIYFFPTTKENLSNFTKRVGEVRLVMGHVFINCQEWHLRVLRKLAIRG